MRLRVLLLSFVFFLIGCFTTKHQNTAESKWIYFINYSKKEDAVITVYSKVSEEEEYHEHSSMNVGYTGQKVYGRHDASAVRVAFQENFYKVEYYVDSRLIGTKEYTKKELFIEKQGELIINKRGKIK